MSDTIYSPVVRKRLRKARERLDYAPFGIMSDVAREVGVQRQYVHSVVKDEDTFDKHRGGTAQKVWFCLERHLEKDPHLKDVEKVITSLRNGHPIALQMGSRFFIFLLRRLKRLGITFNVEKNKETPATYVFLPA